MQRNKRFVASYSGGKDSVLAIYRAMCQGYTPVQLLITYDTDKGRTWFHGIPEDLLQVISDSINIPIRLIKTNGDDYNQCFENALADAKCLGAEVCVFGDIDIADHKMWCVERCRSAGMEAFLPLWGEARERLVYEFIDSGFSSDITIIDTSRMSSEFLGKRLTRKIVKEICGQGVDICGENGEYHSFVYNGPIFKQPVRFGFGDKVIVNGYAVLPLERLD